MKKWIVIFSSPGRFEGIREFNWTKKNGITPEEVESYAAKTAELAGISYRILYFETEVA